MSAICVQLSPSQAHVSPNTSPLSESPPKRIVRPAVESNATACWTRGFGPMSCFCVHKSLPIPASSAGQTQRSVEKTEGKVNRARRAYLRLDLETAARIRAGDAAAPYGRLEVFREETFQNLARGGVFGGQSSERAR